MAKERRLNREIDVAAGTITFTDLSKTDKDGNHPKLVVNYRDFPKEMQEKANAHGWNARLGDVAASPSVDAIPTIEQTVAAIAAGNWGRGGAGSGGPRVTVLAQAMHQVLAAKAKSAGKEAPSLEDVIETLEKMSTEQRRELTKKYPEVAAAKADIEAKNKAEKSKQLKAAAKDADSNLMELFG